MAVKCTCNNDSISIDVCIKFYFCQLQLVDYYRARNRLPKGNCNMTIFKIISDCWSFDEASRPSFAKLAMDLEELLQKIKGHSAEAKQLPQENGHPPMSRTATNGSATITQNGAAAGTQPLS